MFGLFMVVRVCLLVAGGGDQVVVMARVCVFVSGGSRGWTNCADSKGYACSYQVIRRPVDGSDGRKMTACGGKGGKYGGSTAMLCVCRGTGPTSIYSRMVSSYARFKQAREVRHVGFAWAS